MDNYDTEDEMVEIEEIEEIEEAEEVEAEEAEEEVVDWEARAKKAEQAIIKAKAKPIKTTPDSKLSNFDMLALQKANIETEEDLDEVTRWADYNKISVADALKSTILKTVLSEKSEQRQSAMAVNTGQGRRAGGGAVSDDQLMANARKGILPDGDDIGRLALLRIKNK